MQDNTSCFLFHMIVEFWIVRYSIIMLLHDTIFMRVNNMRPEWSKVVLLGTAAFTLKRRQQGLQTTKSLHFCPRR